jgi:hypothetical protein
MLLTDGADGLAVTVGVIEEEAAVLVMSAALAMAMPETAPVTMTAAATMVLVVALIRFIIFLWSCDAHDEVLESPCRSYN